LTRAARVSATLALVLGTWGSVGAIDAAVRKVQRDAEARAPAPPATRAEAPPGGGRVFVLLVDSLRAETAEALPHLGDVRARGAFVRVLNTRDAATVPSLRAAFTGETQGSIFAFARNFVQAGGSWSSVFGDLAARGERSAVFSEAAHELRASISDLRVNTRGPGDEEAAELRAFDDALALWAEGRHRLVVFHVVFADHAAHRAGVGGPGYQHAFDAVDELVRRADAAVPPGDTLVVFGDHGHDRAGRHLPGLDVPTVAVYRGPGFVAGAEAGPVALTIHRYLLSWALGLPLPPSYRGPATPGLLRTERPLPAAFAAPPPAISSVADRGARLDWMLPLYGALALAAALAARRLGPGGWSGRATFGASALGVAAFAAWGWKLAAWRHALAPHGGRSLLTIWLVALALGTGAVGAGLLPAVAVAWIALAVPALLLFPSAGFDGWADGMGRVWALALVALVVEWARRRLRARSWPTGIERLALTALPFLAFCVLPFFYPQTDGVVFNWTGYLTANRLSFWLVLSLGVRAVLFVRPERGRVANAAALAVIALLSLASFGDVLTTGCQRLLAAAALAALAIGARLGAPTRPAASVLANAALLMAFRGSVVLDERVFLQLELLLAALRITFLVARALGPGQDLRGFAVWLEAMALVVTAWSTLALTLYRLEWHVLYEVFAPPFVEAHIGFFLPLIMGRYALPLVLARRLIAEARPPASASSWPGAFAAAGVKTLTLVLVATGYALDDPTGEFFVQAVMNVLTFSTPLLALAYEPRAAGTLAGEA
jgi:hypothetical protein